MEKPDLAFVGQPTLDCSVAAFSAIVALASAMKGLSGNRARFGFAVVEDMEFSWKRAFQFLGKSARHIHKSGYPSYISGIPSRCGRENDVFHPSL
jgi:hypothetical protein